MSRSSRQRPWLEPVFFSIFLWEGERGRFEAKYSSPGNGHLNSEDKGKIKVFPPVKIKLENDGKNIVVYWEEV